jgi:hypothetical protein
MPALLIDYLSGGGRFLAESVIWWVVICLPINIVSILFAFQAPKYIHSDEDTYYYGYGYNSIFNANSSAGNESCNKA